MLSGPLARKSLPLAGFSNNIAGKKNHTWINKHLCYFKCGGCECQGLRGTGEESICVCPRDFSEVKRICGRRKKPPHRYNSVWVLPLWPSSPQKSRTRFSFLGQEANTKSHSCQRNSSEQGNGIPLPSSCKKNDRSQKSDVGGLVGAGWNLKLENFSHLLIKEYFFF